MIATASIPEMSFDCSVNYIHCYTDKEEARWGASPFVWQECIVKEMRVQLLAKPAELALINNVGGEIT
jgi:hypothetical protein